MTKTRSSIHEVIRQVLARTGRPMTPSELYAEIIELQLYRFMAEEPVQVVRSQLRRHCVNLSFPSARVNKYFIALPDGRYKLAIDVIDGESQQSTIQPNLPEALFEKLLQTHQLVLEEFKVRTLEVLQGLKPCDFEIFCRNLLTCFGFRSVSVTQVSRDGGIDGFGKLKVGLTYFDVAFQCKRWKGKTVGRPEIDKFRGAIQGGFVQGIFFTTAQFSTEAEQNSLKPGAVPIVLMNGASIVDFMIDSGFGIERMDLPMYQLAMDGALDLQVD